MTILILSVVIVAGIGLLAGAGLSIASAVFSVPSDERAELLREVLPGANCGACGFSGCDGYAAALSSGKTGDCTRCSPGGDNTAAALAKIMGVAPGKTVRRTAVLHCMGNRQICEDKMDYRGIGNCLSASQLFGGPSGCRFGCLGFGDCAAACPFDAIRTCDGIAVIDPERCRGCGICVSACPKKLITLENASLAPVVRCASHEKGVNTIRVCKTGCIGCEKCVRICESRAIVVRNFAAEIDRSKCTACGQCIDVCPRGCILPV